MTSPAPVVEPGDVAVAVVAKEPRPGAVKTRLCPPCTPEQAATIAAAAIADTLDTVAAFAARERILVFDGDPTEWLPDGWRLHSQCRGGLDERLADAFATFDGPTVLVGMDTPQLSVGHLEEATDRLRAAEAVLGPAADGGWWLLGMRHPDGAALRDVPMSRDDTVEHQRRRLEWLGLERRELTELTDVDTFADAVAVARDAPTGRFAAAVHATRLHEVTR